MNSLEAYRGDQLRAREAAGKVMEQWAMAAVLERGRYLTDHL